MSLQTKFFLFVATILVVTVSATGFWFGHERWLPLATVIASALILLTLLAVFFAASRMVCSPLRQMCREMQQIATGESIVRPLRQASRNDELGSAARAFNQLLDTVYWSNRALQAANQELERRVASRTCELQKSNRELAAAEAEYRSIFENATEGIFRSTPQGRCLKANPAMARLLKYPNAKAVVDSLTDIARQMYVDPTVRTQIVDELKRTGQLNPFETELLCKDGSSIWGCLTGRVVFDPEGAISYFEGTVRDVTAQRNVESLRRRSEEEARKLALVASRTHNPVLITDPAGKLEWANAAFTQLTGYSLEEMVGKSPGTLLQGAETDRRTVEVMRHHIAAGEPFNVELVNYSRSGRKYWLSIDAEPVKDPDGAVVKFIAFEEDITEKKRSQWLERDRRQLLEMVARNVPLSQTLQAACRAVERQCEHARAMVLVRDGETLSTAAAPAFSPEFLLRVDRDLQAGQATAVFNGDPHCAEDVAVDPRWIPLRDIAADEGIVSSRSMPISCGAGSVLGELVLLQSTAAAASPDRDSRVMQSLAGLCGIAIEHYQLTDRLAYQARHDPLTGLPNRAQLDTELPMWVSAAARDNHVMAVLMIDLDGFKHVNDTLGHMAGDTLLKQVALRLSGATRGSDVLVRTGGDEFTLIATELSSDGDCVRVANRLIGALAAPCVLDGRELFVTASVGIAVFPADAIDAESLKQSADAAMYAAKAAGRNQWRRYDPGMSAVARERLELEGQLRRAVENNELHLDYQPQVNPHGVIVGVEALLRWSHPRLGKITPGRFIPVAEQSGLIIPIGSWVLSEACRQARVWVEAYAQPFCMAVNVSALQFQQPEFVPLVARVLEETGLPAANLELELTESMLLSNTNAVLAKLGALREMGVGISIDDFGTGYSSLAYLQKLPIDRLKIDRSFVCELGASSDSKTVAGHAAIISAIVSLASSLGKGVVAEGVETLDQRDYLTEIGCKCMQGFLFSPPVSPQQINLLLKQPRLQPLPLAKSA